MRLGSMTISPLILALALAGSALVPCEARAGGENEGRRTRMVVVLRIAEELDLDEAETIRLATEYRKFDAHRRELLGDKSVAEVELEAALGRHPPDQEELSRLTAELLRIDRELALLPDALFEAIQTMLDTEQKARLALLKAKLQKKLDGERRRRGGGPSAPPSRS